MFSSIQIFVLFIFSSFALLSSSSFPLPCCLPAPCTCPCPVSTCRSFPCRLDSCSPPTRSPLIISLSRRRALCSHLLPSRPSLLPACGLCLPRSLSSLRFAFFPGPCFSPLLVFGFFLCVSSPLPLPLPLLASLLGPCSSRSSLPPGLSLAAPA